MSSLFKISGSALMSEAPYRTKTTPSRKCNGSSPRGTNTVWKRQCPDPSPDAFIFPNARKRNGERRNGFIRTDNYRARVLKPLAKKLELPKLNFQVLRRTMATLAQTKGSVKDVQSILGHSKADTTVNVYMQSIEDSVKQTQEAICSELTARPKLVRSTKKGKNLVRFGTVGVLDDPQVIVPQGQGA